MLPDTSKLDKREKDRRLVYSLLCSKLVMTQMTCDLYEMYDQYRFQSDVLGHSFSITRPEYCDHGEGSMTLMSSIKSWVRTHEEAQVMLASILVVVGLWWLVRTILGLLINLICPLLVVLLAVVLVPQLRAPLLGQNYPAVANVLHTILIKMAENVKQE